LIRQIRSLLYVEGFTISGARNKLALDNPDPLDGDRDRAIRSLIRELEEVLALLKDA